MQFQTQKDEFIQLVFQACCYISKSHCNTHLQASVPSKSSLHTYGVRNYDKQILLADKVCWGIFVGERLHYTYHIHRSFPTISSLKHSSLSELHGGNIQQRVGKNLVCPLLTIPGRFALFPQVKHSTENAILTLKSAHVQK